ncbi:hypothetical protein PsYK624_167820 [Phanerochaete sordida]|uniref:Ubiquitin-like protease family profile domain-containing protein n=1 Tax=Phanerochaete sordida TaxID=48140 RepID=A0A9P3GS42_9APHY|nr:hypothetical protein PsYK624_167820 [Phanerochaete sordida]
MPHNDDIIDVDELDSIQAMCKIPLSLLDKLPPRDASLQTLLCFNSAGTIVQDRSSGAETSFIFSTRQPTINSSDLLSRTIPAQSVLLFLNSLLSTAAQQGHQSFVDPRYGRRPTPLFMIDFWLTQARALEAKRSWAQLETWLIELSTGHHHPTAFAAEDALETFPQLSWDARLMGTYGSPAMGIHELQPLLSNGMLKSNVIDAMILSIRRELIHVPSDTCIEVHELTVFDALHRASSGSWLTYHSSRGFSAVRILGARIASCTVDRLYLPLNVRSNHWAVFAIEPKLRRVRYGDSTARPPEPDDVFLLQSWLGQHDGASWDFSLGIEIAEQPVDDGFSCGILVINAIRHELFGETLWTRNTREHLRIAEYMRLVDDHLLIQPEDYPISDLDEESVVSEDAPELPAESSSPPPDDYSTRASSPAAFPNEPSVPAIPDDLPEAPGSRDIFPAVSAATVRRGPSTSSQAISRLGGGVKSKPSAKKLAGVSDGLMAFGGYKVNTQKERRAQMKKDTEEVQKKSRLIRVREERAAAKKREEVREQDRVRKSNQRFRERREGIRAGVRDAEGKMVRSRNLCTHRHETRQ